MLDIVESARKALETTGRDIFPKQIALEVHYLTQFRENDFFGRDFSPAEIYLFFETLFQFGGYVLAERRDNRYCPHCSEVLLVKALC